MIEFNPIDNNLTFILLVAPLLKDFKFGKSLNIKHFRDFLFLPIRIFLAK